MLTNFGNFDMCKRLCKVLQVSFHEEYMQKIPNDDYFMWEPT